MAITFTDGFDHSASLTEKGWTSTTGTDRTIAFQTGVKRTGTRSVGLQNTNTTSNASPNHLQRSLGGNLATARVAFAYQNSAGRSVGILTFMDNATAQVSLRQNADGTLQLVRGATAGTVSLGTSLSTITASQWYHIEVVVTFAGSSTGSATVYLDGVSVINSTLATTIESANAYATAVRLGWTAVPGAAGLSYYDDLIIADSTNSQGQIGAATVIALYPTSDSSVAWTRSTGSTNYTLVDEATANGDTDYVSSSSGPVVDLYGYEDISPTGSILAVSVNVVARDDGGGATQVSAVAKPGATEHAGTAVATGASYANAQTVWASNPDGGSWTRTAVNSALFGIKRT